MPELTVTQLRARLRLRLAVFVLATLVAGTGFYAFSPTFSPLPNWGVRVFLGGAFLYSSFILEELKWYNKIWRDWFLAALAAVHIFSLLVLPPHPLNMILISVATAAYFAVLSLITVRALQNVDGYLHLYGIKQARSR